MINSKKGDRLFCRKRGEKGDRLLFLLKKGDSLTYIKTERDNPCKKSSLSPFFCSLVYERGWLFL